MPAILKGRSPGQLNDVGWYKLGRTYRSVWLPLAWGASLNRAIDWLNQHGELAWPLRRQWAAEVLQRHPAEHQRLLAEADSAREGWTEVPGFGRRPIVLSIPACASKADIYAYRLLSRLDFFRPLVQAWLLTGNRDYLAAVDRLLQDWSKVRRYQRGWDTVDDSIRILNLLETIALLQTSLKPESIRAGLVTVLRAAWNVENRRARTGNHLIYEGLALFAAGTTLRGHPRCGRWRRLGRSILERQMIRQVRSDGMNGELCTNYHLITGTNFLKAWVLERSQGGDFSRGYRQRLALMAATAAHLQASDGGFIALGDSDRIIGSSREEKEGRIFAAIGRSLTQEAPGPEPTLDQEWLLAGADTRWLADSREPAIRVGESFGGYHLRRGPEGSLLLFDAGPFGLPGASHHGHADTLSFEIHLTGTRFLVDPGGFSYVDHPARAFARSTAAHNTMRVDGRDSSSIPGSFEFGRTARARCLEVRSLQGGFLFCGEHNGYAPLLHRRFLWWLPGPPMRLLVIDRLQGSGRHTVEAFHHADAGWQAEVQNGDGIIIWRKGRHRLVQASWSTHGGMFRILQGALEPYRQGWVSRAYGEYLEAPVCVCQCSGESPIDVINAFVETEHAVILDGPGRRLSVGEHELYRWGFSGNSLQISRE